MKEEYIVLVQSEVIAKTWPEVIKDYNSGMGGVDLLDQKTAAYKLDRKSSGGRYYLCLFFDQMDMSVVNSHLVYKGLNPLKTLDNISVTIVLFLVFFFSIFTIGLYPNIFSILT